MDLISICVYLIIGLLGVAYPILFQVVAGLDQKYNSTLILGLFRNEPESKWFRGFLIASLASIFIWSFHFRAWSSLNCSFIVNSALILATATTLGLVGSFFWFVSKILKYYSVIDFVDYLIKKNEVGERKNDFRYFNAIADILYYSIDKQNITIVSTISNYIYAKFKHRRKLVSHDGVVYPEDYYTITYKIIEALGSVRNTQLNFLAYRSVGGVWLLGEWEENRISPRTYFSLWQNLKLCLTYDRPDFIMYYWENASQHFNMQLKSVRPEHAANWSVTNGEAISARQQERMQYLEFNFALGALLLYRKEYTTLRRLVNYTSSIPPEFVLLPSMMGEVCHWFFYFCNSFSDSLTHVDVKYPFPELDGAMAKESILSGIRDYIALLFLRQYDLYQYYYQLDPVEGPSVPQKQADKVLWLDNVNLLEEHVRAMIDKHEVLKGVGLSVTNEERLQGRVIPAPLEMIGRLKNALETSIQINLQTQEISAEKYQQFKQVTAEVLLETFQNYEALMNQEDVGNDVVNTIIAGNSQVFDKSAFAADQGVTHLNFDSIMANVIANQFNGGVLYAFNRISSVRYLLEGKDFFEAIRKMGVNQDYIIISFGTNIEALKSSYGATVDWPCTHLSYAASNNVNFNEGVFVLPKSSLPKFVYKSPETEEVAKYELQELDRDHGLWASVVDLFKNAEIRQMQKAAREEDLYTKVLIFIFLQCVISFKKETTCARIEIVSPFGRQEIPHRLSDVKKL